MTGRKQTDRFLSTLEINKHESGYQKKDQPVIFKKKFDDIGLIVKYDIRPFYQDKIKLIRTEFTEKEYVNLFKIIDRGFCGVPV